MLVVAIGGFMGNDRIYLLDTHQFEVDSLIMSCGSDDLGYFITMDKTVFHPQGGGQPADQGVIVGASFSLKVRHVTQIDQMIRHYIDQDATQWIGAEVKCMVDKDRRLLHARLHTGGHLISNIVERQYPQWKAVKGHHFPGESYVEFNASAESAHVCLEAIDQELKDMIVADLAVQIEHMPADKAIALFPYLSNILKDNGDVRMIRIGNFPSSPCSGTHVNRLDELKGIQVISCKAKGHKLKISYRDVGDINKV
jgi:alanyl-tRNA synthetase